MVYDLYWSAFEVFRNQPPINSLTDNDRWCAVLRAQLDTHLVVIPQLALGFRNAAKHMPTADVDKFMSGTLRSRIGRRVIAEHHLAMTEALRAREIVQVDNRSGTASGLVMHNIASRDDTRKHQEADSRIDDEEGGNSDIQIQPSDHIGIVSLRIPAGPLVQHCADLAASRFASRTGRTAPGVMIDGAVHASFTYIRDHAEYVLYELLDNAMRFTDYEHRRRIDAGLVPDADEPPPAVRVTVALSPIRDPSSTITFRISDAGGGIPAHLLPHLWSYSHPSKFASFALVPKMAGKVSETSSGLVPGNVHLGIGLTMCRVYAEYWGGSIDVVGVEGHGTDVYLVLGLGNRMENLGESD
ncbi:hypothetical protein HDU93_004309 [Gonapodya sp. JEL0774]|nr:hypothetical protein HDU93_004309 [Gonapodya sp. JEL0774]